MQILALNKKIITTEHKLDELEITVIIRIINIIKINIINAQNR